jgi:hypothetical protein
MNNSTPHHCLSSPSAPLVTMENDYYSLSSILAENHVSTSSWEVGGRRCCCHRVLATATRPPSSVLPACLSSFPPVLPHNPLGYPAFAEFLDLWLSNRLLNFPETPMYFHTRRARPRISRGHRGGPCSWRQGRAPAVGWADARV